MTHARMMTTIALSAALAACGGSPGEAGTTSTTGAAATGPATQATGSQQDPKQTSDRGTEEPTITAPEPYGADPRLSVYVEGPTPIAGQSGIDGSTGAYRTLVTVNNVGEETAELEQARVWFEVWRGDQRLPCAQERFFDPPPPLEPGESHTLQVTAGCPLPGEGEYEVRAYLAFGAEGGDVELERYFAGRYFVSTR